METDQAELLKVVSSFLENQHIPYMITGAWSAIFYGRPRASHDIDFVVELSLDDIDQIVIKFKKLSEDFLIQTESLTEAVKAKQVFQAIHLPTMLKLDFWLLTDEDFDRSRFARRKKVKVLNQSMMMASAEDTIIQKLRWYRLGKIEKHLIDAAFVYQIQKSSLDRQYLNFWVRKLEFSKDFAKLAKINLKEYL